jgi:5-formaminoimidazole-4-carboxamide-1-(beta)-D-ribofuranosyl 5'-monophosphate synthetase
MDVTKILENYDLSNVTIGVLGGHSALDVCHGAKQSGFNTLAVCQKGREKTYRNYYKTRDNKGCIDNVLLINHFQDITKEEVQRELRNRNTIFIHNRYFWVYCNWQEIENDFLVPIYGTREMLKLEERDVEKNQYYLLNKSGIRIPKIFQGPDQIDRLVIVKVNEAERKYERAFFFASSPESYRKEASELLEKGVILEEDLNKATIEEYIIGAHINLNFFFSPLTEENELMGTDTRRQTDLDGFLRLTAKEQLEVLKHKKPRIVETGHYGVTMKESLLEKAYDLAYKFTETAKKEFSPGIIGPFALQGAVNTENNKEEFVIFDVSLRIPGSPGTKYTPYSGYLYGESLSYGQRIAMEIKQAIETDNLSKILT